MESRNSLNGTHNTQKHMKHNLIIIHKSYSCTSKIKGELRDVEKMNNMFNGCDSMKELPKWYYS